MTTSSSLIPRPLPQKRELPRNEAWLMHLGKCLDQPHTTSIPFPWDMRTRPHVPSLQLIRCKILGRAQLAYMAIYFNSTYFVEALAARSTNYCFLRICYVSTVLIFLSYLLSLNPSCPMTSYDICNSMAVSGLGWEMPWLVAGGPFLSFLA